MMNFRKIALSILFSTLIWPLSGATPVKTLTLEQCIDMALNDGLSMQAGRLATEKADIMKGTVFDVDQTAVTFGQETGGGGPDNAVTVSQDFEFPTVYVARHKALKAEAELERSNLDVTKSEVVRDVTACYFALLHARKTLTLRRQQDSTYKEFMDIMDTKYANGEVSRLDQINAQRAYNLNSIELKKAVDDYEALLLTMAGLLNSEEAVAPADAELQPIAVDMLPETELDFASTPTGIQSRKQVQLSERNLALTRQGYMPGISLAATTQLFLKGFNPYHIDRQPFKEGSFLGFEVGVSVPLFFGAQRAKTRAARRDLELARNMMMQARQSTEAEYRNALNTFATAKRNLDYYATSAMPQADEIEKLSKASYEFGEIGYAEHIQNLESAMEIRMLNADAINEYNQIVIQLNFLQGKQ